MCECIAVSRNCDCVAILHTLTACGSVFASSFFFIIVEENDTVKCNDHLQCHWDKNITHKHKYNIDDSCWLNCAQVFVFRLSFNSIHFFLAMRYSFQEEGDTKMSKTISKTEADKVHYKHFHFYYFFFFFRNYPFRSEYAISFPIISQHFNHWTITLTRWIVYACVYWLWLLGFCHHRIMTVWMGTS